MKYEVRKNNAEKIISNTSSAVIKEDYTRSFSYEGVDYFIYMETENEDERKSAKRRKKLFDFLEDVTKNFIREQQDRFNKYNHIIQTISSQISQKMDGYLGDERWYGLNYHESLENIDKIIDSKKKETSNLIHFFKKMSLDLKSHIEGWEIIYIKDSYVPKFTSFSLKKAILNQFSSFAEEFDEAGIQIKFSDYFSEEYMVSLDKKLFSLIMYNFFSNILKYAKPDQDIWFNFLDESKDLDISMYSVKIERSEMLKLFDDGVRGIHANSASSSGNGSGLYVIKKALKLMGMQNMYIDPQYTKIKNIYDVQYYENHFKFNLKNKN